MTDELRLIRTNPAAHVSHPVNTLFGFIDKTYSLNVWNPSLERELNECGLRPNWSQFSSEFRQRVVPN